MRIGRLANLLLHLPHEGATVQALTSQPAGAWDLTDRLLAMVLESLDAANHMTLRVWGDKKAKASTGEPIRVEWPGREQWKPPRRQPSSPAQVAAFFGRHRPVTVIPKAGDNGGP